MLNCPPILKIMAIYQSLLEDSRLLPTASRELMAAGFPVVLLGFSLVMDGCPVRWAGDKAIRKSFTR